MTTIVTKNGSGAPLASDLVQGELAVDLTNKRLYTEDSGGTVIEVGTNPSTIDINAGTIDGTVIGGASAAAGTFTTFTSTGIDDNATSTAITIDASENVGIGTASPQDVLHVEGGDARIGADDNSSHTARIKVNSGGASGNEASIDFLYESNPTPKARIATDSSLDGLRFSVVSGGSITERMRLLGNGNLGIGTTSPSAELDIERTTGTVELQLQSRDASDTYISFGDNDDGDVGQIKYAHSDNSMRFTTNANERMRIDSSGNLLVGTTTNTNSGQGINIRADGTIKAGATSSEALNLFRLSTDGNIVQFYKDGSSVGSIGTTGGDLYVSNGTKSLMWTGSSVFPRSGTGGVSDGTVDLGNSSNRFNDIYATNATIQTSDANEKQDIEALSEAETRVAVAAKGLLRKFRWKSAVEEKGDEARIHFGIIAQDLKAAFEAEGLDAGRYAMFIHSTWTDEETGEERSRMGVRYSELLAFIIAAI
jgi:hypothetical protein